MAGWNNEEKLFLAVNVDRESILGKIAKARALEEELRSVLSEIERCVSVNEESQRAG